MKVNLIDIRRQEAAYAEEYEAAVLDALAGSFRLHHLGSSHFLTISGNEGVQCHILTFERRNPIPVLMKNAAKPCAQQTFSRVGHCSLNHDGFCHRQSSLIADRIPSISTAFSSWVLTAIRYHPLPSP